MKKIILLVWLQILWTAGFSQSLPFKSVGSPIQRTNLVVHWKAPKHPWPKTLWVYQMATTKYSPTVISNLMAIGNFTGEDKKDYGTNGVVFDHPNGGRNLRISFTEGQIEYWSTHSYSSTNLAKDVPGTNQLFQLTMNFLPKLDISLSEIAKRENGKPKIGWQDPTDFYTFYYLDHTTISNVEYREVWFSRAVDSIEFSGDYGRIDFGEHSQVTKIWFSWRGLEHDKLYSAATPEIIMKWMREGKAVQKRMVDKFGGETTVDWTTAKSVTIKKAMAYYWGEAFLGEREHRPVFPSWVHPFATLWATVDTGHGNVDVEIDCPIIDEAKPLGSNH